MIMNTSIDMNIPLLKRILPLLLLAVAAVESMAQTSENRTAEGRVVRGPYETNRLEDNLFAGFGVGFNIYNGEYDSGTSLGKRLAPAVDLQVGKWFTPALGLRAGYRGLSAKGWGPADAPFVTADADAMGREKFAVNQLHGDLLWNISHTIGGYRADRRWNFVPFIGLGWARASANGTTDNEIVAGIGLLNVVRLTDLLDLTLELRKMYVNERFDGTSGGSRVEGMTSLTAGLSFKINNRHFKRVTAPVTADCTDYLERISALEHEKEQLAGQNHQLAIENQTLRNRPEVAVDLPATVVTPLVLFFDPGQTTLDKQSLMALYLYVQAVRAADPRKVFTLTGSVDLSTGDEQTNRRLCDERVQHVAALLTKMYGVSADLIVPQPAVDNHFSDSDLNRCVIIE